MFFFFFFWLTTFRYFHNSTCIRRTLTAEECGPDFRRKQFPKHYPKTATCMKVNFRNASQRPYIRFYSYAHSSLKLTREGQGKLPLSAISDKSKVLHGTPNPLGLLRIGSINIIRFLDIALHCFV